MRSIAPSTRRVHASELTRLCSAIGSTNCRCSPRYAEAGVAEHARHGAGREHAIGLDRRIHRVRHAADDACSAAALYSDGIVEDDAATRRGTARRATRASRACASARAGRPRRRSARSGKSRRCASPRDERRRSRRRPRARRAATSSISADASTPVTIAPRLASAIAARPVPVPTSRIAPPLDRREERRRSAVPACRRSAARSAR